MGRKQRALPVQVETDVAPNRQRGGLNARDTLERQPGTGQVENGLTIGSVVSEVSCQHARRRRNAAWRFRRHEAQFGVRDANLTVPERDLTTSSLQTPAPG